MIIYFADRQLNILGQASTELPEGLTITADRKTEDTETGVSVFECKIPFDDETRAKVEACAEVGNYLLRNYDGENELYSIIDAEIDTKKRQVYIYAEDDGMDLLNEVVGVYEADKAYPITHYINKYAAGAGFQIGINEVESLSRKLSWDGEATAAARIASVATQFDGCEISFSFEIDGLYVVNKYINIYKQRGKDNGAQLRLNQDIDSIITSKSIANLATALQCTGGTPEKPQGVISHFVSGVPYYTWVKFKETEDGDLFDSIGDRRFIGLAWNKKDSSESDSDSAYTWAQFFTKETVIVIAKSTGILETKKTSTGKSRYTWIKFADDANGTNMSDNPAGKTYIGVAKGKSKETKSSDASVYSWKAMHGAEAKARYIVGTGTGAVADSNGKYYWVKYADNANGGGMSNSPVGKKYCGIAVGCSSSTEGSNAANYTWRAIVDNEYVNGEYVTCKPAMFGIKEAGENTYTWIKFADDANGAGLGDTTTSKKYIGFAYGKSTNIESENASDYKWSEISGEDSEPITLLGYEYDDGDFYVDGTVVKSRKALEKWSRFLWRTEESKKTGGHITKQYSYDTTSQQTLCAHAITELKKNRDIEVNYEVDIKKLPRNVKIGDRVNVIDEKGELYLSTRILQLETSVCEQEYKAVLGEYLIKGSGISQKVADLAAQFAVQAAANAKARAEALKAAKEAEQQAAEAAAKAAKAEADLQAAQEEVNAAKAAALEAQAQAEAAELAAAQARADIADMEADIEIAQSAAEEAVTKAEAARSTAETAKTDADTAKTTAQAAKLDAEKAAQDVANLGGELETLSNTMEADYARKTDLTETESSLQTQISQNAAEISSHASSITRIDETANNAAAQAQTAKNAAEAAQSEADQAAADAAKAQQAANNAATAAQNAQNKADTAKTAADAAQTAADNAASKAQQAESDLASAKENLAAVTSRVDATEVEVEAAQAAVTAAQAAADKAKQDAAAAQSTADTAKTKATTAQTAADDAKTAADNAQTAADNAQQAADDAQAAVDALAVRVTTAETKITQNSDEIALRAKKTEVAETLGGYYTKTEADAAIQVKADSITNTVSEIYATKTELAEDAGAAQATANDALSSIATAESVIQQLADSIASLVRDGNGGSLIKQDESGFYYFDISSLEANLSSAANSLLDLEGIVLDINGQIDVLKSTAEALQKRTEYVRSYTDENDRPCLELGEGDSTYKVYITNTGIRLMDGTAAPSIITRQMLVIEKAMIRNELQIGDDEDTTINGVWLWKRRSNGNLGLSWKGVNS